MCGLCFEERKTQKLKMELLVYCSWSFQFQHLIPMAIFGYFILFDVSSNDRSDVVTDDDDDDGDGGGYGRFSFFFFSAVLVIYC